MPTDENVSLKEIENLSNYKIPEEELARMQGLKANINSHRNRRLRYDKYSDK